MKDQGAAIIVKAFPQYECDGAGTVDSTVSGDYEELGTIPEDRGGEMGLRRYPIKERRAHTILETK